MRGSVVTPPCEEFASSVGTDELSWGVEQAERKDAPATTNSSPQRGLRLIMINQPFLIVGWCAIGEAFRLISLPLPSSPSRFAQSFPSVAVFARDNESLVVAYRGAWRETALPWSLWHNHGINGELRARTARDFSRCCWPEALPKDGDPR